MSDESQEKKSPPKGYYLLPNLFTTGALFAGFYSIISAFHQQFETAAIAICVAAVLDGCDGAVARLTNTQSAFGEQYDSMSDGIAFGVAPAIAVYAWSTVDAGRLGLMAAFVFTACAALRLARFNVQVDTVDKKYFVGLPSPAAAGLIATMVWLGSRHPDSGESLSYVVSGVTAFTGLLMVSNLRFHSFKELYIGKVPFAAFLGVVLLFGVVLIDPPMVLVTVALLYVLQGPVMWLNDKRRGVARPLATLEDELESKD